MNIILLWDYNILSQARQLQLLQYFVVDAFNNPAAQWLWNTRTKKLSEIALKGLTVKLFNLKFHPLKVVPRWRDSQLQVTEIYSDLKKLRYFQILLIYVTFHILTLIPLS